MNIYGHEIYCIDIRNFHMRFGLDYQGPPRELKEELSKFRLDFMQEELFEYELACERGDLEGQFDALIDLVYVALGTAHMQGFPFPEGWALVHKANMSKKRVLTAEGSKRNSPYDVVKPQGWKAPDLWPILRRLLDEHDRNEQSLLKST